MPLPKFKLPSLSELKHVDPKRAAIEHGEKVVVLLFAVYLVVSLVQLVGVAARGVDLPQKLDQAIRRVEGLLAQGASGQTGAEVPDPGREWSRPPAQSDPWPERDVVGRLAVLRGAEETLIKLRLDVAGTVDVRPPVVNRGSGYLLANARVNQADADAYQKGQIRRDQIRVDEPPEDRQWAVVYAWFDIRPLLDSYARVFQPYWEGMKAEVLEEAQYKDAFDRPIAGTAAAPAVTLIFDEPVVERQEVTTGGTPGPFVRLLVPDPLDGRERERVLPPPPEWFQPLPAGQVRPPWPPPRQHIWRPDAPMGLATLMRRDPTPVIADRASSDPVPTFFLGAAPAATADTGGIFLNVQPESGIAGVLQQRLDAYLQARRTLMKIEKDERENRFVNLFEKNLALIETNKMLGVGVRFVDTTVKPGASYRYRLAVTIQNPVAGLPMAAREVQSPPVLVSRMSPPSGLVTIPRQTEFFVTFVPQPRRGAPAERADVQVHSLYRGLWRVVEAKAGLSERIVYKAEVPDFLMVPSGWGVGPAGPGVPGGPARPGGPGGAALGAEGPPPGRGGAAPGPAPALPPKPGIPILRELPPEILFGRPGGEPQPFRIPVTFDAGVVLLQLGPVAVWEANVPARRPKIDPMGRPVLGADGRPVLERDWLIPIRFGPQPANRYRAVYLTDDGQLGAILEGEIPEYAQRRAAEYRRWVTTNFP